MSDRLPPRQRWVDGFPVRSVESTPSFDRKDWDLILSGKINNPITYTWQDFLKLPKESQTSDFHCVEGWSLKDKKWEGVKLQTLIDKVEPLPNVKFVLVKSASFYTTSLSLETMREDNVLLAYRLDNQELPPRLGGPLRLIVPNRYAYKSAKWVRELSFIEEDELGYWETKGYHNKADPWKEQRRA